MEPFDREWKRQFSLSFYKNMKLKLAEMTFLKDFVTDRRGDLYPILNKSTDCLESVSGKRYCVTEGTAERWIGGFFPYATYEITAVLFDGEVGFGFTLPNARATVTLSRNGLRLICGDSREACPLPDWAVNAESITALVSLYPGMLSVYLRRNQKAELIRRFTAPAFAESHRYETFTDGTVSLLASGRVEVSAVSSYLDNGVSLADMRPICYEDGTVMVEQGKVYITASVRLEESCYQGVFSWIPSTAELELTGALFYDVGDGFWCGDVAASVCYHREARMWYLWVCSFSHGHRLAHASFAGDPRFGINVIDVTLMEKAPDGTPPTAFLGFPGDEDPDFFYDAGKGRWLMAICRIDPENGQQYRYYFFESSHPFESYRYLGRGKPGCETGGSFVRIGGETAFVCGNDFHATSDYRVYTRNGMTNARFNYPDGGFRGWGTVLPIPMGSRTRCFWMTFDRHNGSDYNWSYGNLYVFEASNIYNKDK
ncbi:MAG: hypothetical protein E7610_04585 [Ruminococcaceae bacterium]|nr:hypothetical protein [Oscillospiraceae bacterium]